MESLRNAFVLVLSLGLIQSIQLTNALDSARLDNQTGVNAEAKNENKSPSKLNLEDFFSESDFRLEAATSEITQDSAEDHLKKLLDELGEGTTDKAKETRGNDAYSNGDDFKNLRGEITKGHGKRKNHENKIPPLNAILLYQDHEYANSISKGDYSKDKAIKKAIVKANSILNTILPDIDYLIRNHE